MFALSRNTLFRVLTELQSDDDELRSLTLIRLGVVERHAGHLTDSLSRSSQAQLIVEQSGPLVTGRYYLELANTLRDISLAENREESLDSVTLHFNRGFYEFVAIGHHRYAAAAENNHGVFLLGLGRFDEAEPHLERARRLLEAFEDKIRTAQVQDTLARLYAATGRLNLADFASESAVACLEACDEEALLAEALTTRVWCFVNLIVRPKHGPC